MCHDVERDRFPGEGIQFRCDGHQAGLFGHSVSRCTRPPFHQHRNNQGHTTLACRAISFQPVDCFIQMFV
jgi:hypothetical protein